MADPDKIYPASSASDLEKISDIQSDLFAQHQRLLLASRLGGFGTWHYDIRNDVLNCDDQWYEVVGRDRSIPLKGIGEWRELIHPDDRNFATEITVTARQLINEDKDYGIVFRIVRSDGEVRWIRSAATILKNADNEPVSATGFIVDVTETHMALERLELSLDLMRVENQFLSRQALVDALTGIANRRRLDQELDRACLHARRKRQNLSVALIDIDFFKLYNDAYGHGAGDRAIAQVARTIASAAWRPYDLAARFGGEEFALILPDVSDPEYIFDRVVRDIASLQILHETSPVSPVITISCGAVTTDNFAVLEPGSILAESDKNLYRAKKFGRNRLEHRRI